MWVKNCIIAPSFQNKGEDSIPQCVSSCDKNCYATEGLETLASKYVQAGDAARKRLAEQTAQQGDQGDANQGNTAASHELLHALRLC